MEPEADDKPFSLVDFSTFQSALQRQGFAVFDRASAGTGYAAQIREEIEALHAMEVLVPSRNRLATSRDPNTKEISDGVVVAKTNVWELDLTVAGNKVVAPGPLVACPALSRFVNELGPALAAQLLEAFPELKIDGVDQVKVQLNEGGGGCFPAHYDQPAPPKKDKGDTPGGANANAYARTVNPASHSSADGGGETASKRKNSRRSLTALLYLNEGWQPTDGGEIRLYPFPLAEVDVAPIFDRLVFFCSTEMLHRVMPSHNRRLCLSVWFSSSADVDCDVMLLPSVQHFTAGLKVAAAGRGREKEDEEDGKDAQHEDDDDNDDEDGDAVVLSGCGSGDVFSMLGGDFEDSSGEEGEDECVARRKLAAAASAVDEEGEEEGGEEEECTSSSRFALSDAICLATSGNLLPLLADRGGRRLCSKVRYRKAYAQSFVDAFGDKPAVQAALALDEEVMDATQARLPPAALRTLLTELPWTKGTDGEELDSATRQCL